MHTSRILDSFSSTNVLITLANGNSNDIITNNANTYPTPFQKALTFTLGEGKFATPVWAMLNLVKPPATVVQGRPGRQGMLIESVSWLVVYVNG